MIKKNELRVGNRVRSVEDKSIEFNVSWWHFNSEEDFNKELTIK